MSLQNIFKKPVDRTIDGVIKAQDSANIWQELDEFVITKETHGLLSKFVDSYNSYVEGDHSAAGRNGVWISGFFGSGKSHFLKILSLLVDNQPIEHNAIQKSPLDFFADKISDALELSAIKKMVLQPADVILLNIEDQANVRTDSNNNILEVLWNQFNGKVGLCAAFPEVAEFERLMQRDGIYAKFCEEYLTEHAESWQSARNKFYFRAPKIAATYSKLSGATFDGASLSTMVKSQLQITADNFCKIVCSYLDSQGKNQRLVYFLDEIGQFIGGDTQRLLQLQTIVESLGSATGGRAMVVVTSQQAIDEIVETQTKIERDAFSRITGRFATRLSLTSSNVNEVIQKRLLDKTQVAANDLTQVYAVDGDILKSKVLFRDNAQEYPSITSAAQFADYFPFMPYQIRLIQHTFEGIRKHAAAGAHLAHGERSLLSAFQGALKSGLNNLSLSSIIPLYEFFPSIQSWLESNIAATIKHAESNSALTDPDFDINLLKTLFMVRYVDQFKANVNNLAVLFLDNIHQDMVELKKRLGASLERLEAQSLISKSVEVYKFLTNEEQDISRQINQLNPAENEISKALIELVVDGGLNEVSNKGKFEYSNKKIFEYEFQVDGQAATSSNRNLDFKINFITERDREKFSLYQQNSIATLAQDGEITLVLAEGGWLRELHNYVKTNKFISERALAILDERSKSIIRSKQDDNQTRKQKLVAGFKEAIRAAQCWINGRVVNLATSDIKQIIAQICEYYIDNNYSNLQLIAKPYPDPVEVSIRNLIQHGFDDLIGAADVKSLNPKAYSEVESYLQMQKTIGQRVNLTGLINRFERKPFGWQEQQTAALLGEMYLNNGINLVYKNQIVAKENIPSKLFAKREWADIYLEVKEATPQELLNNVGKLYHELFKQLGNTLESALQSDYLKQLKHWQEQIQEWRQSASAVSFPLDNGLSVGLTTLEALGNNQDNILPRVWDKHSELKQLAKIMEQTTSSFMPQLNLWRQLSDNLTKFKSELNFFANTELLKQAFSELNDIHQNKDLAKLPQVKRLIHQLSTAYTQELINFRHKVIQQLDSGVAKISAELDLVNASADERNQALLALNKYTRDEINEAVNFAHLAGIERNLTLMIDEQIDDIHQQVEAKAKLASLNNSNLSTPATAQPRKIRRIMARNYVGKTYLETTADVDNYLSKLRHELIAAIAADNRVEIN